jgi:hypothetical protein
LEYDGSNLIEFAIWRGRSDVVRMFHDKGLFLDSRERALSNAAEAGHVEMVNFF